MNKKLSDQMPPWTLAAFGCTIFTLGILAGLYAFYSGEWRWGGISALAYLILRKGF